MRWNTIHTVLEQENTSILPRTHKLSSLQLGRKLRCTSSSASQEERKKRREKGKGVRKEGRRENKFSTQIFSNTRIFHPWYIFREAVSGKLSQIDTHREVVFGVKKLKGCARNISLFTCTTHFRANIYSNEMFSVFSRNHLSKIKMIRFHIVTVVR